MSINPNDLFQKTRPPGESPISYITNAASLGDAVKKFATNTLNSVSNKTSDATSRAQSLAESRNAFQEADDYDPNSQADKDEIANAKKMKKGFDLMAIFKIVPIGMNVIAKAPNLASGAADVMVGLQKALINTGINIIDFFKSFFSFSIQGFKFAFVLLICLLENMSNFNSCVIFYFIDICLLIIFLLIFSLLSLLDALFFEKTFGFGLVQFIIQLYEVVKEIEEMIFNMSGIHLLEYPKCVQKMCYTCSIQSNHREVGTTGGNLLNALTSRIPRRFMEPIHKFISAGKKFASIFKI